MVHASVPAFVPGAPGGPELLIILFIFVLLLGVPLVVIAGAIALLNWRPGTDEEAKRRIAELEREVERLKRERGDE